MDYLITTKDEFSNVLKQRCTPIVRFDDSLHNIAHKMRLAYDLHNAVGLSAPQIGHSVRVIMDSNGEFWVNPKIIQLSESKSLEEEQCLSVPDFTKPVLRHNNLTLRGQNLNGEYKTHDFFGLACRIIQHELDHLEGILIKGKLNAASIC